MAEMPVLQEQKPAMAATLRGVAGAPLKISPGNFSSP
jgi:hypothetical protein